jgi:MurNAc alpha-1-phosphate uridylyltransferase
MAAVVLAAGAGSRLRPLSDERPKALCPVGGVPLVDLAVQRVRAATTDVTVNVHHGRQAMEAHLGDAVRLSIEEERALGTAGALGAVRDWIAGRPTVVVNADAWCPNGIEQLVTGWDGERIRLLIPGGGQFGPRSAIAAALMPWTATRALSAEPSGLYELSWREAAASGKVEVVAHDGPFVDCGTPAKYLEANLAASGGQSVVGSGADVLGALDRSVVWDGASVGAAERLVGSIRTTGGATVLVRPLPAAARS